VLVLGLETSGKCGSVALVEDGNVLACDMHDEPNAHAERLLPLIDAVLDLAKRNRRELSRIAVGTGPGNFTGLRVGISLSYGLAMGLDIPVVGVSSLAALAHAVRGLNCGITLAIRDARKNEFFGAVFDSDTRALTRPCVIKRAEMNEWIKCSIDRHVHVENGWTIAGDGLQSLDGCLLAKAGATIAENAPVLQPDARHVAHLGARCDSSDWPLPEYVREVDAVMPLLNNNPASESAIFLKNQEPLD
jgi:tRNA threonylcarbamoyladenosine biosynthesis protein TsaB